MKSLLVSKIVSPNFELDYSQLANSLKHLPWNLIDKAPWQKEYPYTPEAKFQIAYDDEAIYIHYHIQEEFIKAQYIRPNENIWEDSCVEFFISFDNREHYYNLEFNVLGAGLIGFGTSDKATRNRLSAAEILSVNTCTEVKSLNGKKSWKEILRVPLAIFGKTFLDVQGQTFAANFYKCGDELPNPHFMAWNNIDNPKPNFHLPEFFGDVKFQ